MTIFGKISPLGQNFKSLWLSLRVYFVFGNILSPNGQFFMIFDKCSLLLIAQYLKDNLATWSHCSLERELIRLRTIVWSVKGHGAVKTPTVGREGEMTATFCVAWTSSDTSLIGRPASREIIISCQTLCWTNTHTTTTTTLMAMTSVTRLGDLLAFGQPFKAFGNN